MSQFSTSTQNQAAIKAACLSCGLLAKQQDLLVCDSCHFDLLREVQPAAINFGDDVNTAPTSPTVPVGNTGTTSTGHELPFVVPESDTLWQYLSKGMSLTAIRDLESFNPRDAQVFRERVQRAWAVICAEVNK